MICIFFLSVYCEIFVFKSLETKLKETETRGVEEKLQSEPDPLSEAARDTYPDVRSIRRPSQKPPLAPRNIFEEGIKSWIARKGGAWHAHASLGV